MRLGLTFITSVVCGPVTFDTLMAMQDQKNGIGNEVFFNGNEGVKEHWGFIKMLLASNNKDVDIDVGADIELINGNVRIYCISLYLTVSIG